MRDERGNVTISAYDRLGRIEQIAHPSTSTPGGDITPTESFVYDAVGNLIARTDRRGETTA